MAEAFFALLPEGVRDEVAYALAYTRKKHEGQHRIDGEPYVNHVVRVADAVVRNARVANVPQGMLRALAISALLHDVVEDTDATVEEVCTLFGEYVAQVVLALSHVEEEEPDAVYLARVARGGVCAVLVKRYDKLDNLHSLVLAPTAFREKKIRETWDALPLWDAMDPEGAAEIRRFISPLM